MTPPSKSDAEQPEMTQDLAKLSAKVGFFASDSIRRTAEQVSARASSSPDSVFVRNASTVGAISNIGSVARAQTAAAEKRQQLVERGEEETSKLIREMQANIAAERVAKKAREAEQMDLLRRSTLASEEALTEERRRTADARAVADAAAEEARVARRNMRISLWFAAGSLLVAAWPFIKEAMGW